MALRIWYGGRVQKAPLIQNVCTKWQ